MRPLRIFLVGLGADDRTERMVGFLANNSGMDISLITFHGFAYDGKTLLARQVRVEGIADSESRPASRYRSVAERRARLEERMKEFGVTELFGAVRDMFRENWPQSRIRPRGYGLSIKLQRQTYARIDVWGERRVWIIFQPCAKALCLDAFKEPVAAIPYSTSPRDRDPLGDADAAIEFKVTAEDWETHEEALTRLARAVYEAHQQSAAR